MDRTSTFPIVSTGSTGLIPVFTILFTGTTGIGIVGTGTDGTGIAGIIPIRRSPGHGDGVIMIPGTWDIRHGTLRGIRLTALWDGDIPTMDGAVIPTTIITGVADTISTGRITDTASAVITTPWWRVAPGDLTDRVLQPFPAAGRP
jgi:hypothetical protein